MDIIMGMALVLTSLLEYGFLLNVQPLGFYCNDPTISHKFEGDTITAKWLMIIVLTFPLFMLILTEWYHHEKGWLKQSLFWYRDFFSGLIIVGTITVVIKTSIGEPRPHFLDSCKPKEAINCTQGFIPTFECTNKNVSFYTLSDANKSFPSGHAAISFYFFLFLSWFMQQRFTLLQPLIVLWLQIFCFFFAIFCSVSRITDRRHHWWDVVAGIIIGICVAIFTIKTFKFNFNANYSKNNKYAFDGRFKGNPLFHACDASCHAVHHIINKSSGFTGDPELEKEQIT